MASERKNALTIFLTNDEMVELEFLCEEFGNDSRSSIIGSLIDNVFQRTKARDFYESETWYWKTKYWELHDIHYTDKKSEEEYKEAIKILNEIPDHIGADCDGYELRALRLAKEALEKQMPKKSKIGEDISKYDGYTFTNLQCPVCDNDVGEIENYTKWTINKSKFCSHCGQAIDWSEEECHTKKH